MGETDDREAASDSVQGDGFQEWAVIELMGHQVTYGRIAEVQMAGAGFFRIDVPGPDGGIERSQFVNPSAIYRITPTTEDYIRTRIRPRTPHTLLTAPRDDDYDEADL